MIRVIPSGVESLEFTMTWDAKPSSILWIEPAVALGGLGLRAFIDGPIKR